MVVMEAEDMQPEEMAEGSVQPQLSRAEREGRLWVGWGGLGGLGWYDRSFFHRDRRGRIVVGRCSLFQSGTLSFLRSRR